MPSFKDKIVVHDCLIKRQTEKAILVAIPDMEDPVWIPQSQVDDDSEVWKEGDEGDLVISEWIASQKGIR